jgi:hypothetical protein
LALLAHPALLVLPVLPVLIQLCRDLLDPQVLLVRMDRVSRLSAPFPV